MEERRSSRKLGKKWSPNGRDSVCEASIGSVSALKRNSGCSTRNLFDDFETFVRRREMVDVLSPRNTIFPRARGKGGCRFNEAIVKLWIIQWSTTQDGRDDEPRQAMTSSRERRVLSIGHDRENDVKSLAKVYTLLISITYDPLRRFGCAYSSSRMIITRWDNFFINGIKESSNFFVSSFSCKV